MSDLEKLASVETHPCRSSWYLDTGRKQFPGDREIRCSLPTGHDGDVHAELDDDGAEANTWPVWTPPVSTTPVAPTYEPLPEFAVGEIALRAEVAALRQQLDEARAKGERWRRLAVDLTRCEHGRVQGDTCSQCPDRTSPSQAGQRVGHSLDGTYRVVIPPRDTQADPDAWYVLAESLTSEAGYWWDAALSLEAKVRELAGRRGETVQPTRAETAADLAALAADRDRLSGELEAAHAKIDHLEREVAFWREQRDLAANVAAGIADLDEEAPALRQMLRTEKQRREAEEARSLAAEARLEAAQHELGARDYIRKEIEAERDRLLVVYRAAEAWRDQFEKPSAIRYPRMQALMDAVDSYRSAAPAEPAPAEAFTWEENLESLKEAIMDQAPVWEHTFLEGNTGFVVGVPDAAVVALRWLRAWAPAKDGDTPGELVPGEGEQVLPVDGAS